MKNKIVYAVQYIEVEFGQRDEGYALYLDLEECIKNTKEDSRKGASEGGYLGPERPLCYVEIPFDCLDEKDKKNLKKNKRTSTADRWQPQFKSKTFYI